MSELETRLLNDFQRGFPLLSKPFVEMAERLGTTEPRVIGLLCEKQSKGYVSRVGPVFRPHAIGTSTLAAMSVPPERLVKVARIVNLFEEVNHNYEREHRYNLWFVLTAPSTKHLASTVHKIEKRTGFPVILMPLRSDYHIDLSFDMRSSDEQALTTRGIVHRSHTRGHGLQPGRMVGQAPRLHKEEDLALVAMIQRGFPLVSEPFAAIGRPIGLGEDDVIKKLAHWLEAGIIKRVGVVVRHRAMGYRANAMVVWDVPEDRVDALGHRLAQVACVSLCYLRARQLPQWPYNLYCMIHGRDRNAVLKQLRTMARWSGAQDIYHEVLFSRRCFKQRGAIYRPARVGEAAAA